jgi:hypothetical protein
VLAVRINPKNMAKRKVNVLRLSKDETASGRSSWIGREDELEQIKKGRPKAKRIDHNGSPASKLTHEKELDAFGADGQAEQKNDVCGFHIQSNT